MEQSRIEKFSRGELPDGRVPSLQEVIHAELHQDDADPALRAFLDSHPEYRDYIRSCLEVEFDCRDRKK